MFTKFYDLHSGGYRKTKYAVIYIELNENEAITYFERFFGIDPLNTTCQCCGDDFDIYETDETPEIEENTLIITLEQINA
jgi:hypothetical protein